MTDRARHAAPLLALLALCSASSGAEPTTLYRCGPEGKTLSDRPCGPEGGEILRVQTPEVDAQARRAAQTRQAAQARAAAELAQARQRLERQTPRQAGRLDAAGAPAAQASAPGPRSPQGTRKVLAPAPQAAKPAKAAKAAPAPRDNRE